MSLKCKGQRNQYSNGWPIKILLFFYAIQMLNALSCFPSDLPEGVSIAGTCDPPYQRGCRAICQVNGNVIWREAVSCLKSGKWSSLPPCRSLELLRCSKPNKFVQESHLACVKIHIAIPSANLAVKAVCPDVLRLFSIFGNCSSVNGTKCAVECNGFVLLCLVNSRWSSKCSLPAPLLCPELKFVDLINCSRIEGVSCKVLCPNGKMANEEATCMPTQEWFPLPDCQYRRQCASQTLPDRITFLDPNCQSSDSSRCKVGCSVASGLVGVRYAECMPWGEWRGLPKCNREATLKVGSTKRHLERKRDKCKAGRGRCSRSRTRKRDTRLCSPLPEKFIPSGICSRMLGTVCKLKCKNGNFEGNGTVLCFLTGEWSEFPFCPEERNSTCPRKVSPFVSFVANCSFAEGTKCQVRCQKDYVLVGLPFISCEKNSWKYPPKCFPEVLSPYKALKVKCSFPPRLHGSLKVVGSCNPEGGMSCEVACREESAYLRGPNATTCLPSGNWTYTKSCAGGEAFCPEPVLSKHLEVVENCSGKAVEEECQVRCKARPDINSVIICTDKNKWSAQPKCKCPAPILKSGMELAEMCKNKQPNESCSFKCKPGFSMVGKGIIICNDKLKWASTAFCSKIICEKPKIGSVLVFKEDCMSKSPGDSCELECEKGGKRLGKSKIHCIDARHWTKLPDCACPTPVLDENLKPNHNCNETLQGQKCFLNCRGSSLIKKKIYITCQRNFRWSEAPKCKEKFCPKPILPEALTFGEDCSSKGPNERCHLKCREKSKIFRTNYIVCLNATHWSSHPKCSCPIPLLKDFLTLKGECKDKFPGQHCSVTCKRHAKIVGNNFIRCLKNMTWTNQPKCKMIHCVVKKLPPFLLYKEECTDVSPDDKCFLKCKDGGNLIGPKFIACKKGTLWTPLPTCSCPRFDLSEDLSATENCSEKTIGEKCHLKCKERFTLLGENFIQCQRNRQWTVLPRCKRSFCSELKLPKTLVYKEDCSSKLPGDHCQLACKSGGEIVGHKRVACVNEKKWTELPKCACPRPKLNRDLVIVEDCLGKLPGQRCGLKCKKNEIISGNSYIRCGDDTEWSTLPNCKPVHCLPPKLPDSLSHVGECSTKSPGESCLLRCHEGGQMLGSNRITCSAKARWSPFPTCACAVPHLAKDLSTIEPCHRKIIGERCRLTCKNGLSLTGEHFITCQKNTRWSLAPECRKSICPTPKLGDDLMFLEDCSSKAVGEKCRLKCKEETAIRPMHISCIKASGVLGWSHPLPCTCPQPVLSGGLYSPEDCSRKRPGDTCKVECSKNLTLVGRDFITCENGVIWSPFPRCN